MENKVFNPFPIVIAPDGDCTVTVQVRSSTITDHTGTRKGPNEIVITTEDNTGANNVIHIVTLTKTEAIELIQAVSFCIQAINITD